MKTKRLELVPHSPQALLALIQGVEEYARVFGKPAAEGLREFLVSDDVSPEWLAALRQAADYDPWTHGFAVVQTKTDSVVGTVAFKGPPGADGTVEIAYGIAPPHQNQGFATEAARALIDYADASGRVHTVRAHTLPEPNASTHVLTKCGFKHLGEVIDPEDGPVWRWELPRRQE